jgi:hypothetical protein
MHPDRQASSRKKAAVGFQRTTSIGLASLLIVSAALFGVPAGAAGDAFGDDNGSVFEPDINALAAAGITKGCGGSSYCPNAAVSRAEIAVFLARAMNLAPRDAGPFIDISSTPHAQYINAIAAAGITIGCSSDSFCPHRNLSRAEMATFLVRAVGLSPSASVPFADLSSNPHAGDIAAIAAAGVTTGCGASAYCPHDAVTRAQMAAFLTRAFKLPRIVTAPTTTVAPTTTAAITTTVATVTTVATATTAPRTTTAVGGTIAPAGAVTLRPGDDVNGLVAAAGQGTRFWFSAGTYQGVSIQPKSNMVFQGAAGAILHGNGKPFAFRSGASGVTIQGLVIEGYRPPSRAAVIDGAAGGRNWVVQGNEIRNNGEVGMKAYIGWRVIGNFIHHNGRYGLTGSGADLQIKNNEISHNAHEIGATGDSGGTKFVLTTNLILEGNNAHHNYGNGIWVDINNVNALIANNRSVANTQIGIFLEISCGGVIRNNYVEGNGTDENYRSWAGDAAGITVSMTPNAQVYGNSVIGNAKGIGAIHWAHPNLGAVTNCSPQLRNLQVYHNSVSQSGGMAAGIDASTDSNSVFGSWGNRFYSNSLSLSGGAQFRWRGTWLSAQGWANAGQG